MSRVEPAAHLATTPRHAGGTYAEWRFAVPLVLSAVIWLSSWYGDTVQSMIATWLRSETFTHAFLIFPISAWMIWRRRRAVASVAPRPEFLVLPLVILVGFGWLLGHLAAVVVVQQFALVLMIPLLTWVVVGTRVVRLLAFPLFFLLFAVPFGEFLVPFLMTHTADFTVFALKLTGIPVYREGQIIMIPSGNWSVVEACGGLRYLIASVTLGFLYANLTYRTLARRALFVTASVIVPIIANWLRAYMIVMIGHLSGMKYAVGIDHLIYGWIFFGVVMLILFWIGSFWRDSFDPLPTRPDSAALAQREKGHLGTIMVATIAVAAAVAAWPMAAARLEANDPSALQALKLPRDGLWRTTGGILTTWKPHFLNPTAYVNQTYENGSKQVGLYIGYYHKQRQGAELITSQNELVHSYNHAWRNLGEVRRIVAVNSERIPAIEAQLQSASHRLLVWRWYWVDGHYTVNRSWAKLLQAMSRLLGHGDDAAVVIVFTQIDTDRKPGAARLQDFVGDMLPAITRTLRHAR